MTIEVEDVVKHERVAKALEQVNGLRYRYQGAMTAKPQKKEINVDSDEGDEDSDDDNAQVVAPVDAKARKTSKKIVESLSLDDHIERMLLRTRTVALLKIANNTAEVLPDDDEDDDDDYYGDGVLTEEYEGEEYDDGSFSERTDGDMDEMSDRFDDSDAAVVSPCGSHSSSMRRIGSLRKPMSSRNASFRSGGSSGAPLDPEAAAALRLVRKLSTFLSLPKVISYKDLEDITESLLDEPHDQDEEYAHLIDEHIDSARDSTGGDSSAATETHGSSSLSLGFRHMGTKKSLVELNISEDALDLELQQRRMFVENAGLHRYSSKKLVGASNRNLLRGASHLAMSGGGSFGSPSASSRDLVHKDSKRTLAHSESWRSAGPAGSIASLAEEAEDKDDDDENGDTVNAGLMGGDGVLGTTFDELGYKQWRTEIKDDYLAWIRAKLEAKKLRKLQKQKDADKKPRWQLLYEAASKGRPGSATQEQQQAKADRKGSTSSTTKRQMRQSVS